jgi:hypothetical protein
VLAAAADGIYYCDRSLLQDAVNVITFLMKFHRKLGVDDIYVWPDVRPCWWHSIKYDRQ